MNAKIDLTDYTVENKTICDCGHEFTLKDINGLLRINNNHGFYGNTVKDISKTICPNCHKATLLLLKQVGQTYEIIDIATPKTLNLDDSVPENNLANKEHEFICPECKKVCKSRIGLNSHIKIHQK